MRLGAFTAVVLRSLSRDRTAMFCVLVLPVIVIVIIGTTFGGARRLDVGLVVADRGLVGERVAAALDEAEGIAVQRFDGTDDLAAAVRRVRVGGGLVLPAGTSEAIERGSTAEVQWVSGRILNRLLPAQASTKTLPHPAGTDIGCNKHRDTV